MKIKVKENVWVNKVKLRKILDKVSIFYAIFITLVGLMLVQRGLKIFGGIVIIMSIPLWIIQFSKIKFDKNGGEDGTIKNNRKTE